MKSLGLATDVPFAEHSGICFRSRTNFTTKLKGFGSVPLFPKLCGQLNSLQVREMAKFSLVWQVPQDLLFQSQFNGDWALAKAEFSSYDLIWPLQEPFQLKI